MPAVSAQVAAEGNAGEAQDDDKKEEAQCQWCKWATIDLNLCPGCKAVVGLCCWSADFVGQSASVVGQDGCPFCQQALDASFASGRSARCWVPTETQEEKTTEEDKKNELENETQPEVVDLEKDLEVCYGEGRVGSTWRLLGEVKGRAT